MNENSCTIPISFLQSGLDLKISDNIYFKHPTVEEILYIDKDHNGLYSEQIYYNMISVFLADPYNYMVYLDDHNMDYEQTSCFTLFVMLFKDMIKNYEQIVNEHKDVDLRSVIANNIYFKAFSFFMGIDYFFIYEENDKYYLCDINGNVIIDETIFNYIFSFVKLMNGIEDNDRIYPENNFAKSILIDDEREKLKRKKNKIQNEDEESNNKLGNMLSSITWCAGSITPFNRNKLHIYDLIDGINRFNKLLNYKFKMFGLHGGTIDKKSINIRDIHWSL